MSASRELLTEYQQQLLTSFQDITQIQEEQLCIDLLQQNGWSLESAVNNFMQGPSAQESSSSATRRRPEPSQPTGPRSSNRVLQTEEPPTNQPAVADGSGLLDLILLPFRWLFKPQQLSINPNRDAENFISEFNSNYDLNHVPFHNGSYQSAVAAAFQQSKFLIVYIHSPLHEDTDTFCQQVLCNQSFINFVNENTIVWGGRVWDPEAYGLSLQLSVSAFPFLGLLICQSVRTVQVSDRVQGMLEVDPLITRLRNVTSVYSAIIERNRMEAHRRLVLLFLKVFSF
jgi:FAS-associated factor 2